MTAASVSSQLESDYEPLVMQLCEILADTDCRFVIAGFGCDDWRADVAYDLSVVVEQLPSLLAGIRLRVEVELDLYSQGIERSLQFTPQEEDVMIQCHSRTSWIPSPSTEGMGFADLELMLIKLAVDFAASLELAGIEVEAVSPFGSWIGGVV